MHNSLAEIMVCRQPPKHPAATVHVDIRAPFLWPSIGSRHGCWFEYPDRNRAVLDGTFLLGDLVHIWPDGTAVGDEILCWVFAEVLDGDLVRVEAPNVVLVPVLEVNGVEARSEFRGDAVEAWLTDGGRFKCVKRRVACSR